jgi:hypothetical protein
MAPAQFTMEVNTVAQEEATDPHLPSIHTTKDNLNQP